MTFVKTFEGISILYLALQVGGVLAAAVFVAAVRRRRGGEGWDLPGAAALVSLAGGVVLFVPTAWDSGKELDQFRQTNANKAEPEKRLACAPQSLVDVNFINWVKTQMPERARYRLVVSQKSEEIATHFCIRYLLLPRVETRRTEDAGWMVFWEEVPNEQAAKAQRRDGVFMTFDPNERDRLLVRLRG